MNYIIHLKTHNFMGESIDESISQKMIYTGENTSGKSKRSIAVALCILGFIPFAAKPAKNAGDILSSFGDGQEMSVEITCNGHTFLRSYHKDKTGKVSTRLKYDGVKISKSNLEIELYKSGVPQIVDVNTFIKSSDTDRINTLFKLYPPKGDVSAIDSDIEVLKKKISSLNEKISGSDSIIKSLTKSKNSTQLPAGSLAETQKEIKSLTDEILTAQKELKAEEIRLAEIAAAEKAKAEKVIEKQEQPKHEYENHVSSNNVTMDYPKAFLMKNPGHDPAVSIQKIIDAMNDAGCSICAGLMVAKAELRKYK